MCQILPTDRFKKMLTSFMDDPLDLFWSLNNNCVCVQSIGICSGDYLFSICVPIYMKQELKELKNIFINMYYNIFMIRVTSSYIQDHIQKAKSAFFHCCHGNVVHTITNMRRQKMGIEMSLKIDLYYSTQFNKVRMFSQKGAFTNYDV